MTREKKIEIAKFGLRVGSLAAFSGLGGVAMKECADNVNSFILRGAIGVATAGVTVFAWLASSEAIDCIFDNAEQKAKEKESQD